MIDVSERVSPRPLKKFVALARAAAAPTARQIAASLQALAVVGRRVVAAHLDAAYRPDDRPELAADSDGVEIEELSVAFGRRSALRDVTGTFAPASLTAVVGANGAGKSSLLKAIAGVVVPRTGKIRCAAAGTARLAYLPQQAELDRSFPIKVAELIALGGWAGFGSFRPAPDDLGKRIAAAAAAVRLENFLERPIADLSVGEFQRALFARLILQNPMVILLDEPFASVDERTTQELLGVVRRWHEERRTVIAALHDLEHVREHFPQCVLLARSLIGWGETTSVLSGDNLARARLALGRGAEAGVAP
jgi:zinc/manganese transport system ATP-binding protein